MSLRFGGDLGLAPFLLEHCLGDEHNSQTPCAVGRGHEALVGLLLNSVLLFRAYPRGHASLLGMLPLEASGSYRHASPRRYVP